MMDNDIMPYSYHTFMYPFYWTSGGSIPKNKNWKRTCLQKTIEHGSADELLTYATYQYFTPKARRLIFDQEDGSAVRCYRFEGVNTDNSSLDLRLDGNKDSSICHRLRVNQLRLELLDNLGIGVLILETENYGKIVASQRQTCHDILAACSQEQRLNEIIKINDLGRRVFSPYLMKKADETVQKGGEAPWKVVLRTPALAQKEITLVDCTDIDDKVKAGIFDIEQTPDGFEKLILGEAQENYKLHPAIDDRMFVIYCLGVTRDFAAFQLTENGKYMYQSSQHSAELLYKMLFLERNDPTCQNREMMQQKLRDHLDPRWIENGTVHGVTEYSLLCITGCDASGKLNSGLRATVINPFLTEYVEMAKIAVLQRAAMIQLEDKASEISREIGIRGNQTTEYSIERIKDLWNQYLLFQSELLLPEVTFQEQGVEIYDILKNSFRIAELSMSLNTNMYNLHEMSEFEYADLRRKHDKVDSESDSRLSRAVNYFSVMGISLALAALAQDAVGYTGIAGKGFGAWTVFEIVVLILEFVILYKMNKKLLNNIQDKQSDQNDSENQKYKKVNKYLWAGTVVIIIVAIVLQLFFPTWIRMLWSWIINTLTP